MNLASEESGAEMKRKKLSLWIAFGVLGALIVSPWIFVIATGVTGARKERAEALNREIESVLAELPPPNAAESNKERMSSLDRGEAANPPIDSELAALVESMYRDFAADTTFFTPRLDPTYEKDFGQRMRNILSVINLGRPPEQVPQDWAYFLENHGKNIERLPSLWERTRAQSITAFDELKPLGAAPGDWTLFKQYMDYLGQYYSRQYVADGDTRQLAEHLVAGIYVGRLLHNNPMACDLVRNQYRYFEYARIPFRRTDWDGLDWSGIFPPDHHPVFDRNDLIRRWDAEARKDQEQYRIDYEPLKRRMDYHVGIGNWARIKWSARSIYEYGSRYDEITRWRGRVMERLRVSESFDDVFAISQELPYRERFQVSTWTTTGKIVYDPALLVRPAWTRNLNIRLLDAALRIMRGETIPDNPEVESPFYFPWAEFRLIDMGEGKYQLQLHNAEHPWQGSIANSRDVKQFRGREEGRFIFYMAEPPAQPAIPERELKVRPN